MDEIIGFVLYQSCGNRGSVGRVSVFWLWRCGWLLLLYALFNHPRLLIQVARVQKAQFSYRLDGLVP